MFSLPALPYSLPDLGCLLCVYERGSSDLMLCTVPYVLASRFDSRMPALCLSGMEPWISRRRYATQ